MGTSPTQLYRLLDQTKTRKPVDRTLALLIVLDCEVEMRLRPRRPSAAGAAIRASSAALYPLRRGPPGLLPNGLGPRGLSP
jgi:hypothetical protein